jgi:DNA-binding PadR family transcriptional regulator
MEKKLLILGVLRNQEMHGYHLSDHLEHGGGREIALTKSNAYKLLNKLEEEGWVTAHEEREGNRPPRRVYAITPEGEAAFQRMLRESLAAYPNPEFPSLVVLNYLDALPADEVVALLGKRREKIEMRLSEIDAVPAQVRSMHLGIAYLRRFYSAELEWLDEVTGRLTIVKKGVLPE